ncbi:Nickel transport system permease protein NikB [archaeon HR06]|nr:Nickel transport system permease protein NikB [archaeon HR06]
MGTLRNLAFKSLSLILVLLVVLLMVTIILGATGISDKILNSIITEQVREYRQSVIRQITNPEELNKAVEAYKEELIKSYGLNEPWYTRLGDMMLRIIVLDLGNSKSLQTFGGSNKISDLIMERLPNTILLVTTAIVINFFIGLYLGVKLATVVGAKIDRGLSYFSAISYALPTWWTGIIFILIFSFYIKIFPFGGMYSAPPPNTELGRFLDLLWHVTLPIIVLVLANVGVNIYVTRSLVLNIAQEDFVAMAKAKGLPDSLIRKRYIIRVAAPPILTNLMLGLATSIGGAILTETVFDWPGMGRLFYDAIATNDESLILALTYMFTLIYVIARFLLKVLYLILDPKVRYK